MKLRDVVIFVVGAAVGGLVATKIVSDKYEKIIKKEVDDTREAYNKLRRELKEKYESKPKADKEETPVHEVMKTKDDDEDVYILDGDDRKYTEAEMREKLSRIAYDHGYSHEEEGIPEELTAGELPTHINGGHDRPYPISPKDVGELSGYVTRRLIKYANGVITEVGDFGEDVIFEIDDIVGFDNIEEHIGDYEEHMLYVRNDKYKSDYTLYECDDLYESAYS